MSSAPQTSASPTPLPPPPSFARRAAVAVSLGVLILLLVLLLGKAIDVLLTIFAGLLLAVMLTSLANGLRHLTKMPRWLCLTLVALTLFGGIGLAAWLAAPNLAKQVDEMVHQLPEAAKNARGRVEKTPWGKIVLKQFDRLRGVPVADEPAPTSQPASAPAPATSVATKPADAPATAPTSAPAPPPPAASPTAMAEKAGTVIGEGVSRLAGALLTLVLVLAIGLYLAVDPGLYVRGLLHLLPQHARPRAITVMAEIHYTLRWWLIGQSIDMAFIGLITGVGLYFIGVPLALTLGVLAGLFNFIPNLGPFFSLLPALLLALAAGGGHKAGLVLGLYVVVQTIEGYVLQPLVQRKAVELPPVITLTAQVVVGLLTGLIGLALAAPLVAVVIVLVKRLYVEDVIGDKLPVPKQAALP